MNDTSVITEGTAHSNQTFSTKINHWAEGVLMTVDADGSKITIRGAVRPYATEYAKMLKKIHTKIAGQTQAEAAKITAAIRADWRSTLENAYATELNSDVDFTFHLPAANERLVVLDETPFYNRDAKAADCCGNKTDTMTDKECKALHELKDLKVGESVVVGYESGMISNSAYVVIKANKRG